MSGDPDCPAALSSRGPTDSEAVKPDVLAPGTYILAAARRAGRGSASWTCRTEPRRTAPTATSAGRAWRRRWSRAARRCCASTCARSAQLANPSAALLKAILIASARRIKARDLPGGAA